MSKSMKTLAAASVLAFGTAVSGAAFAGCAGSHEAKDDKMTTTMETGSQTSTTTTDGKS